MNKKNYMMKLYEKDENRYFYIVLQNMLFL